MPVIRTENLQKTYNPGTELAVPVLRGVTLSFDPGKFYAIIGKSGCGKSTLMHLLGALDRPTGGSVFFGGDDVFRLSRRELARFRRRRIGFVFQAYNLLSEHTALENILMPLYLDGRRADPQALESITQLLGIEALLAKYPAQLSGGEQQRTAIARALITRPDVILADEPTGNLDPATGEKTMALLRRMVSQLGQTLILVTHDMDVAANADVIIRMGQGQVDAVHTPQSPNHTKKLQEAAP